MRAPPAGARPEMMEANKKNKSADLKSKRNPQVPHGPLGARLSHQRLANGQSLHDDYDSSKATSKIGAPSSSLNVNSTSRASKWSKFKITDLTSPSTATVCLYQGRGRRIMIRRRREGSEVVGAALNNFQDMKAHHQRRSWLAAPPAAAKQPQKILQLILLLSFISIPVCCSLAATSAAAVATATATNKIAQHNQNDQQHHQLNDGTSSTSTSTPHIDERSMGQNHHRRQTETTSAATGPLTELLILMPPIASEQTSNRSMAPRFSRGEGGGGGRQDSIGGPIISSSIAANQTIQTRPFLLAGSQLSDLTELDYLILRESQEHHHHHQQQQHQHQAAPPPADNKRFNQDQDFIDHWLAGALEPTAAQSKYQVNGPDINSNPKEKTTKQAIAELAADFPEARRGGVADEVGGARERRAELTQSTASGPLRVRRAGSHAPGNRHWLPESLECQRLKSAWGSFREAYPSLAAYLAALSSSLPEVHGQQFVERLVQGGSRALGRLLEEANRVAHEISLNSNNPSANNKLTAAGAPGGDQLPTGGGPHNSQLNGRHRWLARVLSNPAYAKLVQKFHRDQEIANLRQRLQQHQQQQVRPTEKEEEIGGGEQADSLAQHVYGRVVHYPHEIGPELTPSKTLQKLHQLGQQHHQLHQGQQQPAWSNEIDRVPPVTESGELEVESNRIQRPIEAETTGGGDGEPWPNEPRADSARNKFVYGKVILAPQQGENKGSRRQALETLRQMSASNNFDGTRLVQNEKQQQGGDLVDSTSESYGRVLVSPPNPWEGNSNEHQQQQTTDSAEARTRPADESETVTGDRNRWLANKSSLDKLRQQIEPNQFNMAPGGEANLDELAAQQHTASASVHSVAGPGGGSGASQLTQNGATNEADEFEGVWHSEPLQNAEVSGQMRTDGQEPVVQTTSSSNMVFHVL